MWMCLTSHNFPSPWCVIDSALLHSFFREKSNSPNRAVFTDVHISLCCNTVISPLNFIHPLSSICGPLRTSTGEKNTLETLQSSLVITKSRTACRGCKEVCKRDHDLADRSLGRFSYSCAFKKTYFL